MITRSEVRANRQKWIDFLMEPGRLKTEFALDRGCDHRCCLGHGAFALGVDHKLYENGEKYLYGVDEEDQYAPHEFVELVGLHNSSGYYNHAPTSTLSPWQRGSLVDLNDNKNWSPRQIAEYLQSAIEGHDENCFKPLTDYPETV